MKQDRKMEREQFQEDTLKTVLPTPSNVHDLTEDKRSAMAGLLAEHSPHRMSVRFEPAERLRIGVTAHLKVKLESLTELNKVKKSDMQCSVAVYCRAHIPTWRMPINLDQNSELEFSITPTDSSPLLIRIELQAGTEELAHIEETFVVED